MNQPPGLRQISQSPLLFAGKPKLYAGAIDCLRRTIAFEGIRGLYKGFWPVYARMMPWNMTFWLSYEQFRRLAGVSGF